jgi:hypothetical protein
MKKTVLLGMLALMMAMGAYAADEPLTHPDTKDWTDLFKSDLSNAEKPDGVWTFDKGELTANKDEAIWSQKDYKNYILDLEFRNAENSNSGVIIYCSDVKNWIPNAIEVQILDDFGKKWEGSPKSWYCGAIFGHLAPTKNTVKKPGEWNHMTIRCIGKKIDVALNGEHVTSMDMDKWTSNKTNPDGTEIPSWLGEKPLNAYATKGRIGLQGKHAEAPIFFRNIKVKELK